jgi:hypothetical protein
MDIPKQPPGISPEAQAAIAAQQRIYQQELGLELQLRNAALHEAVENSSIDNTPQEVVQRAVTFLKFLKTGESNE